jgi:regulator of protease activity HflC (stomatin/prohibitin superfamily)
MEGALAWIGQIAEWFGQFVPRRVVLDTTEGAVKWVADEPPVEIKSGTKFWWWPWTSKQEVFPIVRQTDTVETQTLVSKDRVTFLAKGALTYEVNDLLKLLTTVHSPVTAIVEIASTAIADVLCKMTWQQIAEEQERGTLKTKLKNAAQNELSEYGVNVIRFKLNSLAPCRVYKIAQSTSSEER